MNTFSAHTADEKFAGLRFGKQTFLKFILLMALGRALASPNTIEAATNVVNSLADSGVGSLREALINANPGDTINIVAQGTLLLSAGEMSVTKNLEITGPGMDKFVIDAQKSSFHFLIANDVTARISNLTLTNGYNQINSPEGQGGAIRNLGNLTLTHCAVWASTSEFGVGGGIFNTGFLILRNCTIAENLGLYGGGVGNVGNNAELVVDGCAIFNNFAIMGDGGGIFNLAPARLTNTTISGNLTFQGNGGGVYNFGSMDLRSCTVVSNRAVDFDFFGNGGGLYKSAHGSFTLQNTIVAGNSADSIGSDCFGEMDSQGYNLIQNSSGWTESGDTTGNIIGLDPQIGPLKNNSSPAWTHALLEGSPAIDRGNAGILFDQRGFSRPHNFPQVVDATDGGDIGAFEFHPAIFLPFEAESSVLAVPITSAADPLASAGQYIVSPNGSGSASFTVAIPEPARYVIWCRVLATSFAADSFFVSADGGPELIYDAAENIPSGLWQWTRVIGRNAGSQVNLVPRVFPFDQGNHTLRFRAREANTKLDRVLITDDINFVPVISFEAELAGLTPPAVVVSDSSASRRQCVASPVAEQGSISFNFGIPMTNQYLVWCRVLAPDLNADSFYVSMDGGPELIYDIAEGPSPFWQWTRLISQTNGEPLSLTPRRFPLGQSPHTLVFRGREANARLDRILITNDPKLNPATTVEHLPGGILQMTFFDEAARTNRIQATGTLAPSGWSDIAARVADWNGFFIFQDMTTEPSRFYRTISP